MKLNDKITPLLRRCKGRENMAEYLSREIIHPSGITNSQKTSAKKAILWLISKAPHNVDEIAEHFEISPDLVKFLMDELIGSGLITKDTINKSFYSQFQGENVFPKMERLLPYY